MNREAFSKRLIHARQSRGLSQSGLANTIGVKRQVVNAWERDNGAWPGFRSLVNIQAATKCDLHWLLTGEQRQEGVSQ